MDETIRKIIYNNCGIQDGATLIGYIEELLDRNNKAIEYIENNFISYEDSRTFGRLGEEIDIQVKEIRELFNILKGVDKE